MTDRTGRRLALAAAAIVVCLLLIVPMGWSSGGIGRAPHPPQLHANDLPKAAPRPGVWNCPVPPPAYGSVGGFWPPTPSLISQLCPGPLAQDTIHGTFSSNAPGSGQRFHESVYLPHFGNPGPTSAYNDVFLGMVVAGDPGSIYRQSYLQLIFTPVGATPNSTGNWSVSIAVWALHNASAGGNCSNSQSLTWNNSFWCEKNMLQDGAGLAGPTGIPGGTWYNVTFTGIRGNTTNGMWVWANDSTNPVAANNVSVRLNASTDGGPVFEPYYDSSCADKCFLNWSFNSFGLGIGWDLCPTSFPLFAPCDSYNQTSWDGTPSVQFGIPQYFVNASAGWSGDYQLFAPMSGSAECSSTAVVSVAFCPDYNFGGGTGFYPFFSWNGSLLNFGDEYPWTVEDFGGEYTEYIQSGPYQKDFVPTFLDKLTDDSRAGFLHPGGSLNVTAAVSDLGKVVSASVRYTLNSGSATTIPMARTIGTAQRGTWLATIPVGPNGWINYTVNLTNNASEVVSNLVTHVFRGPLPVFQVQFITAPTSCTNVTVNGTRLSNGSTINVNPGTYPITSTSCYPYQFSRYSTTPGLRVLDLTGATGNLSIGAAGTVYATWVYVRPNVTVNFTTRPAGCGTVLINNKAISDGGNASLALGVPASLSQPSGCASESFAGWTVVGNITVSGNTIVAGSNGTLTANFINSLSGSSLTFYTVPSGCGAILYRGAGYTNGMSLTVNTTPYRVSPSACSHWGFANFSTTGGVSLTNGNLTVSSAGTLTEVNYVLTEVTVLTYPGTCTVQFDGVTY
ncbi:MAG TPA: hypothetical protein VJQ43_01705, partial [Thermoplasmata archaeon]|nr:hypothetical protein [Thermoplasmata archaeon]